MYHYEHLTNDSLFVPHWSRMRHAVISNSTGQPVAIFEDEAKAREWMDWENDNFNASQNVMSDMDLAEGARYTP